MKPADIVIVDLDGKVVEGRYGLHRTWIRTFASIALSRHRGRGAHPFARCHSLGAGRREIPCFGTTHADYFYGSVPVAGPLSDEEIDSDYELNTGLAIVRRFEG